MKARLSIRTYSLVTYPDMYGNNVFSRGVQDRSPRGLNRMDTWIKVNYHRQCTYYVLINCIRHCVKREFIQNYFKTFSFLLIWDKNLGSHTG